MKEMKRIGFLMLAITLSIATFAQSDEAQERRELMESIKQDYIMERMELSEEESKKMTELSNDFREKMKEQRIADQKEMKELRAKMRSKKESEEELTEEEARMALTKKLQMEEKRIRLEKDYTEAMIDAISAKKTVEYKKLEKEFKRELLEMLKDEEKSHQMKKELMHRRQMERKEMNRSRRHKEIEE